MQTKRFQIHVEVCKIVLAIAFEVPVVHESLLKCNVLSWGEAEGAVAGRLLLVPAHEDDQKISSLDKLHFLFPHTHPTGSCRAKIEMDMAPTNAAKCQLGFKLGCGCVAGAWTCWWGNLGLNIISANGKRSRKMPGSISSATSQRTKLLRWRCCSCRTRT